MGGLTSVSTLWHRLHVALSTAKPPYRLQELRSGVSAIPALAVCLLVAQLLLAVHGIEHLEATPQDADECHICLLASPLDSGIEGQAWPAVAPQTLTHAHAHSHPDVFHRISFAYDARAPPALT